MRFLVLGGTAWLGRHVAEAALSRGDEVTCLARGVAGAVTAGLSWVRADMAQPGAYERLLRQDWDVVLDVARQPGQVRGTFAALADRTAYWTFVSSGNVYADQSRSDGDETGALLPATQGDVMESMETYGQARVACEQHVLTGMGADHAMIARVGLIGGPGDVSDRSGYWPLRFARPARPDGAFFVPEAPSLPADPGRRAGMGTGPRTVHAPGRPVRPRRTRAP